MSLLVAPARVHGARAIASRSAPRLNPLRAATLPPRPARSARRVAASASLSSTAPALFELAGNANQLVDGCGVNGTCGQVAAPPFALIGGAILISAAVLFAVTFGLKGGAEAQEEMRERDKDFFGKK